MKINAKPKRKVIVTHGQQLNQTLNYQGAQAHYSITLECDESEIQATLDRAEKIVEKRLGNKAKSQAQFLRSIAPK